MRDELVRDALLAALDAEHDDAVSQAALADWYEEHGDPPAAACLRWLARDRRRPFYYPRPGDNGPFLWIMQEDDPIVADALAQSFVELRVLRLHNWRTLSRLAHGVEPGPESSVTKLAWTEMTQNLSARALAVVGPAAPLWWGARDNPGDGFWQRQWLWSKAASIAGGTSEVQRTIIGERLLRLPR